ncbi:MAG: hypothetical protein K2J20_06570, partial [Bacilli bacterium]|nr:hypothetical protein [Bacilli bacterium]
LNPWVEIALLLEKNNLTYENLIELATSDRYNSEFQRIFGNIENIPTTQLLELLKGNKSSLRDNLFIGDSRTHGILNTSYINQENTVYGDGCGYNWFIGNGNYSSDRTNALNGAINGIQSRMSENGLYNIIIWLGVNDLGSASNYAAKYKELASGDWANHNIYIVSVGPVNDALSKYAHNAGINNFNNNMKNLITNSGLENLSYIDLNLSESSIISYDKAGIHYSSKDYQNICGTITTSIASIDLTSTNDILGFFYNVLKDYDQIISQNVEVPGFTLTRTP